MPRNRNSKSRSSIIELDDSSSNESQSTNPIPTTSTAANVVDPAPAAVSIPSSSDNDDNNHQEEEESSSTQSTSSSNRILTRRQLVEQLPVASRTKSANKKGVARMRLLSMDFTNGKRQGLSSRSKDNMTKLSRLETKKKHSIKDEIHEVVEAEMKDPELSRLLRKIAYCRVFTNYLFRQYDMLSIDFQLYSNLDDLMLDLKRRVGAYNAIRRSRLQILSGAAGGGGGGGSNSSREGSTV